MKKVYVRSSLLLLCTALCVFVAEAAYAEETGYVVGRVYLKIDGFQGVNQDVIESADVEVAYVKDNKLSILNTTTDDQGYFVLKNRPMDGKYYPYKIQVSPINQPLSSIVPEPDPSKGIGGMLYLVFSSQREAVQPIIDCGETIILLKAGGKLAVERRYNKNRAILDFTQKKPYNNEKGNYGYSGLEHYAKSGSGNLLKTAKEALQDRQTFARAEPLKKEADDFRKSDMNAAVEKYRAAIQAYPSYDDAYTALASVLKKQKKKKEAVQVLQEAQRKCPASDKVKFELGKLYVETGQAAKAVSLLEAFLKNNTDNLSVYENLAKAYHVANRQSDADHLWQKAIASVKSENRFRRAANFYKGIEQYDKAVSLYEKYLAEKPKNRWAFGYLADAYFAAGRYSDGDALWQRGLRELDKDGKYYTAAKFYQKAGKHDKAIPLFQKYEQAKPNNKWAKIYLIRSYISNDKLSEAVETANRGNKAIIYWNAYRAFAESQKYEQAEQMLRKAQAAQADGTLSKDKGTLEDELKKLLVQIKKGD